MPPIQQRTHGGFTLIELMLTVSVIGILAAVGMPQYNDYLIRTRVAEGLQLGAAAQKNVMDYRTKQEDTQWTTGGIHYQRHGSATVARGNLFAKQAHSNAGSLHARMPDITLTMRPAIATQTPTWSVIWLCGDHAVPPGWNAAPPPSQTRLSTAQSTHMCRNLHP